MAIIMTVDHSAAMRQMLGLTLNAAGHEVIEADGCASALEWARTAPVLDLIITEVKLPAPGGLDLIKTLRGLEISKSTPILVLTSEAGAEAKAAGRAAGATGWILKPYNPRQLLATLNKVL